jgi:hypothetical protein
METKIYCKYGCGQEAKFKLKDGQLICAKSCNSCPAVKEKNSNSVKKAHKEGRIPGWGKLWKQGKNKSWNKNLTKETDERIKLHSEAASIRMKNNPYPNQGRGKTIETENLRRKKISIARLKYLEKHSQQCKWFEYNNGKKNICVQGTWEKKFVEFLISQNIKWDRFKLSYNKTRTYTPDFYLPDYNIFVEIKGWMRDRDKFKMWKTLDENHVDIRLVDNLQIIEDLYNKKIGIKDLEKFKEKYPFDKIDFLAFDKKTLGYN